MYRVTKRMPLNYDERRYGKPLVCLEDEHGGQSVIAVDDHCFVLLNGSDSKDFRVVSHWCPEAARALVDFLSRRHPGYQP